MTDTLVSQLAILSAAAGGDLRVSMLTAMAAVAYPTPELLMSQLVEMGAVTTSTTVTVSQAVVMVAARGRVENPQVRVWTFSLDGHDFYVLRLGDLETLVYDTYSEKWVPWGSEDSVLWRVNTGSNWLGGESIAGGYGSSIVVGDHAFGTLYFLDPNYDQDDNPYADGDPSTFTRIAQGQISHRGIYPMDCFSVTLSGSFGETLTDITLSYTDDQGHSYTDAGTISVAEEDYAARVEWTSLGVINAPGRLFKLVDTGLRRIDSLEYFDASAESE